MSYNGPSALTPEDTLLQMHPLDPASALDESIVRERNLEYLIRARRKAAAMMNLDCKRIAKDPLMKGNGKDCFLVELKGFEKQNSQKIESESQADKHEYVLIYPQGSGRPSGKRVPLTQKTSQRDYGMPDNMMKGPAEQDLYMQGYRGQEMMHESYGNRYPGWGSDEKNNEVMNPL